MVANEVLPVTTEVIKLVRAEFEEHPSGLTLSIYRYDPDRTMLFTMLFTVNGPILRRKKYHIRQNLFTGSLPECCRFVLDYWKLKYVEGM